MSSLFIWFFLTAKRFHKLGYKKISSQNIAEYCYEHLWKRQKPTSYFQQIKQIKQITPNHYFDFKTLQIQRSQTPLDTIDVNELM